MEYDFKAGDVVKLKSGGPLMTIKDIGEYGIMGSTHTQAKCEWFEGAKRHEAVFELVTLKPAQAGYSGVTVGRLERG